MTKLEHIIGIDIGTTSTKVILFNTVGTAVDQCSVSYLLLSPQAGVQEQNPEDIYQAVVRSVRTLICAHPEQAKTLIGLSFSTAMHSLIAVDQHGVPLTNSITWADRRSAPWVNTIRQNCDTHALYTRTGLPLHPMSPLVKLVWLRNEKPEIFQRAAKFISIKEYMIYRWCQQYVVDYSIANASGLFNMHTLDWDEEALSLAEIAPRRLSQLVPTTHILTSMVPEIASSMGLPATMPVVIGASDGALGNLGVGATTPDTVAITLGTSGALRAMVERPQTDQKERLFCYALTPERWVIGGAVNNGGIVLRWVRENLAPTEADTARLLDQNPYDMLTAIAATIPAGSEGLIFHPYLAGERSPLWNANARGSFFGLGLNHTKAHMIRAVLEGIVYNLYTVLTALEEVIGPAKSIQASGGFARSTLWRQMLADIFDRTVMVPQVHESSCFGAAVLGLYALGRISDLTQVSELVGESDRHQPIAQNVSRYQTILPLYIQLLESFTPLYTDIAKVQATYQD
ncbi:MAG: gluconokinase [Phormidesmis sp.]